MLDLVGSRCGLCLDGMVAVPFQTLANCTLRFSRRWVVQEIALSPRGGTVYCGDEEVSWQDFADAVSLFVEVESATHRLSDVMRQDKVSHYIPDFFGDVSSLGAALLVDATSNLFRNSVNNDEREPLSTLEYLVSRLTVFDASQPRDTIYALLAIAEDTKPKTVEVKASSSRGLKHIENLAQKQKFISQPYNVDYNLPLIDVYREFVQFSIRKSVKTRALDIICRPWAPTVRKSRANLPGGVPKNGDISSQIAELGEAVKRFTRDPEAILKSSAGLFDKIKVSSETAAREVVDFQNSQENLENAAVSWTKRLKTIKESAEQLSALDTAVKNISRDPMPIFQSSTQLFATIKKGTEQAGILETMTRQFSKDLRDASDPTVREKAADDMVDAATKFLKTIKEVRPKIGRVPTQTVSLEEDEELVLPSWIPVLSGAAFEMEEHPKAGLRMERQNADPLVGMPGGQRYYKAAGSKMVSQEKLAFKSWGDLRLHGTDPSMYVEGFVVDKVSSIEQIASNGNLPYQWLTAGGWKDTSQNPPEELWRTLVADRGPGGRNPPTYFPRACREAMKFKANTKSKTGNIDCKKLINEGRCTIVAEFLRRTQAVIWNRLLMRTEDGRLGLVRHDVKPGYRICILYGCSVPVVLQEFFKTRRELQEEHSANCEAEFKKWEASVETIRKYLLAQGLHRRTKRAKLIEKGENAGKRTAAPPPPRIGNGRRLSVRYSHLDYRGEYSHIALLSSDERQAARGFRPQLPLAKLTSRDMALNRQKAEPSDPAANPMDSSEQRSATEPQWEAERRAFKEEQQSWQKTRPEILEPDSIEKKEQKKKTEEEAAEKKRKEIAQEYLKKEAEQREEKIRNLNLRDRAKRDERRALVDKDEAEFELRKDIAKHWQPPRPNPKYYRLFGECYVHGMMNGEAIAIQNAKEIKPQVFELR
jgi:hypothetical protein